MDPAPSPQPQAPPVGTSSGRDERPLLLLEGGGGSGGGGGGGAAPAEEASDTTTTTKTVLDVSHGSATAPLAHLGPLVVHQDGKVSRIANWAGLTAAEQERTLRVLGRRNRMRLEALGGGGGTAASAEGQQQQDQQQS